MKPASGVGENGNLDLLSETKLSHCQIFNCITYYYVGLPTL